MVSVGTGAASLELDPTDIPAKTAAVAMSKNATPRAPASHALGCRAMSAPIPPDAGLPEPESEGPGDFAVGFDFDFDFEDCADSRSDLLVRASVGWESCESVT